MNYFETLNGIDCSKYVEKKGKFSYLSWSFAVAELLKRHPDATWKVYETPDGSPGWITQYGHFVKVGVTVNGTERIQIHPVLDNNNKPIKEPTCFQINTSIQRALVKAIALHGLGLYIYAGEDLPDGAEKPQEDDKAKALANAGVKPDAGVWDGLSAEDKEIAQQIALTAIEYFDADDAQGAADYLTRATHECGIEVKTAINGFFNSKQRSALKALNGQRKAA